MKAPIASEIAATVAEKAVDSLEARQSNLEAELRDLTSGQTAATRRRDQLQDEWSREDLEFRVRAAIYMFLISPDFAVQY